MLTDFQKSMVRAKAAEIAYNFNSEIVHAAIIANRSVKWNHRDLFDGADIVADYIEYGINQKK